MRLSHPLAIVLMALNTTSCADKKTDEKASSVYPVQTIEFSNQTLLSDFAASVTGCQTVEIRPQVDGMLTRICIREGDAVRKGQVLFEIDPAQFQAAYDIAQANVNSAEAAVSTAQLVLGSNTELYKEKVISDFELNTAKNELAEAKAKLKLANAELEKAATNLSYTKVKSPVNGVASMIPYRVGALVGSNIATPLVTVSDDGDIYTYFSMAENQMLDLIQQYGSLEEACRNMPSVGLTMSNGKVYEKAGRIDAISGTIDESTGVVTIRAVFPNENHLLRNGGSGTVSVPTIHKNCIVIPKSATYELQNRIFTWKVVDGKTQSAPISVYKYNDGQTYIVLSGLSAGDIIIAEGAGLMKEGTTINTNHISESVQ